MRLVKDRAWFPLQDGVEFEIRRIPPTVAEAIRYRHFGAKIKATYKKGFQHLEEDAHRSTAAQIERATYALVNSRGKAELPADMVPLLATEADKDGYVTLDGKWTDEVKAQAFTNWDSIVSWIVECSGKLDVRAAEDEDEKKETWSSGSTSTRPDTSRAT